MSLIHKILYMLIAIVPFWRNIYTDLTHFMFLFTIMAAILETVIRMLSEVRK